MSNIDKAMELAFKGFHVFPVKADKTPLTPRGYKDASRDQFQIQSWWDANPQALVGVATGPSNIIVADIDVKKGKDGFKSLQDKKLSLPPTFTYKTPSGGEHHVYYSTNANSIPQQTNLGELNGVDRQSGPSYVVWYGETPWDAELAAPPVWLTDLYGSAKLYDDAPEFTGTLPDWVKSLDNREPSYFVQGFIEDVDHVSKVGNDELRRFLWRLAFMSVEGEYGVRRAYGALKAKYWGTSGESDEGKEKEWERLLRGALAQAKEAERRGDAYSGTTREWTPPVDGVPGVDAAEDEIKVMSYADLLAIPEPTWWIESLFKEASLGVVAGSGGLGKSFLMLHMAGCIATGTPFFHTKVKKGKVLYVAAEGIEEFAKRIKAMCDYHHMPLNVLTENMFFVESGVNLSSDASMNKLTAILKEQEFDFIILDTLSQVTSVASENDAAEMSKIFRTARRLRGIRPGSTIVTVHHANRASGSMRGSSAIRDNVDTVLAVNGNNGRFSLSTLPDDMGKQRSAKADKFEGFELIDHLGTAVVAWTGVKPVDPKWEAIRVLLADGVPRSLKEIAKETGLSESVVEDRTKALRKSGGMPFEQVGKSKKYTLTPLPEEEA